MFPAVGARIAALPGVEAVSGMFWTGASTEKMPMLIVYGYHPREFAIRRYPIIEGRPLEARRQVLVGRTAAEEMGVIGLGLLVAFGERVAIDLLKQGLLGRLEVQRLVLRDAELEHRRRLVFVRVLPVRGRNHGPQEGCRQENRT